MASTYYTGRVHSIFGPNLKIGRHLRFAHFFSHTIALQFLLKIEGVLFRIFFHKSVLGSPDSNLSYI